MEEIFKSNENNTEKDKGKKYGVEVLFDARRYSRARRLRHNIFRRYHGRICSVDNNGAIKYSSFYAHAGRNLLYRHI